MRVSLAAVAALACLFTAPAAMAQSTADLTAFNAACTGGESFLIGQLPEGTDTALITTPLCACLAQSFGTLPQADVDMLTADLTGAATDETRAASPNYPALAQTAQAGLQACMQSPEVVAAFEAALPPEPVEPAAEPAPQ
ncbi:MAG: hypothetical protein ACO1OG_09170 [Devosia sp.]